MSHLPTRRYVLPTPVLPSSSRTQSQVAIPRGTAIDDKVSELRDLFHTFVDIADLTSAVPSGHFLPTDGKSLLCLLRDPTGELEQWVCCVAWFRRAAPLPRCLQARPVPIRSTLAPGASGLTWSTAPSTTTRCTGTA